MRIAFLYGYSLAADVLYRTMIPSRYVSDGVWANIERASVDMADAFWIVAPAHRDHVDFVRRARAAGKPVILDITENIDRRYEVLPEGQYSAEVIGFMETAATLASGVAVVNRQLIDRYKPFNANVQHVPMVIDADDWPIPSAASNALTWWGDGTYKLELESFGDPISRIIAPREWLKLYHVSFHHGLAFPHVPGTRHVYYIATTAASATENLNGLKDSIKTSLVAVQPLRPVIYNQQRSDLQYLRYAAGSLPVVASFLDDGQPGIIAQTYQEWENGINLMLDDHVQRKEMGEAAREYARSRADFTVYEQVFESGVN